MADPRGENRVKVDYEGAGEAHDRELSLKGILGFTAGVTALIAIAFVLMWLLFGQLKGGLESQDARPSPLAQAREAQLPPEPRLQTHPETDLISLRAEEERELRRFAWVDENGGIARVPVDTAVELILRDGLPQWETASPAPSGDGQGGRP